MTSTVELTRDASAAVGVMIPDDELPAAARQVEVLLAAATTVDRWCRARST